MGAGRVKSIESYYRALDQHEYDQLNRILAPGFVHDRPDMTLCGRDRFVEFMRDERPMTDTDHVVDATYTNDTEVAVRGRLLRNDRVLFGFLDVFTFADEEITRLQTFTRRQPAT